MKRSLAMFLVLVLALAAAATAAVAQDKKAKLYKVSGFVGKSTSEAAPGASVVLVDADSEQVVGSDQTNFFGKYTIKNVPPGVYQLRVEKIQRTLGVKDKNVRLDIDLSAEAGLMDYAKTGVIMINKENEAKAAAKAEGGGGGGQGGAPGEPPGPSDPAMMQAIAAEYYSYSGSTERKVMLCPGGTFQDSYEGSYSGRGFDSGGNQTMAWGQASEGKGSGQWAIQGDAQSGTITLVYNNGKRVVWNYKAARGSRDYYMNGTLYARSGPARCK